MVKTNAQYSQNQDATNVDPAFEKMMKDFLKKTKKEGVLEEVKRRRYYINLLKQSVSVRMVNRNAVYKRNKGEIRWTKYLKTKGLYMRIGMEQIFTNGIGQLMLLKNG